MLSTNLLKLPCRSLSFLWRGVTIWNNLLECAKLLFLKVMQLCKQICAAQTSRCYFERPRTVRRCRFGNGTFRRWWLQMYYAKNMCVFEIPWRLTTKDVCFISVFVVILVVNGQCSFPTVRILEELGATVTTRV